MLEGVLRHCTDMTVKRQMTDSHGQSEIGFAFSHLLGFRLLPRLKPIHSQRLALLKAGTQDQYPHLKEILDQPIKWEVIHQQYDQMGLCCKNEEKKIERERPSSIFLDNHSK